MDNPPGGTEKKICLAHLDADVSSLCFSLYRHDTDQRERLSR